MPTSFRKLQSSRANGAKSTGPTSDRGRQAVTLNAVKHGLSAQTVILRSESPEEYQAELHDYLDYYRPQGPSELHLVHQVAAAGWRLARYASVESGLLDNKMDEQSKYLKKEHPHMTDKQRLAIAFNALAASSPSLALVNRYQARLHHEYQRILKSLLKLQEARRAAEAELQNEPNPISEHPPATPEVVPITGGQPLTNISPEAKPRLHDDPEKDRDPDPRVPGLSPSGQDSPAGSPRSQHGHPPVHLELVVESPSMVGLTAFSPTPYTGSYKSSYVSGRLPGSRKSDAKTHLSAE